MVPLSEKTFGKRYKTGGSRPSRQVRRAYPTLPSSPSSLKSTPLNPGTGRKQRAFPSRAWERGLILLPAFTPLLVGKGKPPEAEGGAFGHVVPGWPGRKPPEAGGEGVEEAAGFSMHNSLNQVPFSPSPPMGERAGVRGK